MNTIKLFVVVIVSIILLITHSYFKRGFRLTFNFFLFAFIAAMMKETGSFFTPEFLMLKGSPFFFPKTSVPFAVSFLTVVFGWIFAFYLAWDVSEKIIKRLAYFNGKIFPAVLFAGITVAAISYAVETIGVNTGWWRWKFHDARFSGFLIKDAHFFAIEAWFYFAIHFLTAYFIIECSKFRKAGWKCVFLLIYFIRIWAVVFSGGSDLFRIIEERIMLCLLIGASFLTPLKFNAFEAVEPPAALKLLRKIGGFLRSIPSLVMLNLIATLSLLVMVKIKNPQLIVSILPLLALNLLAVKKINFIFILFCCLVALIWKGKMAVPAVFPVVLFGIFWLIDKVMPADEQV